MMTRENLKQRGIWGVMFCVIMLLGMIGMGCSEDSSDDDQSGLPPCEFSSIVIGNEAWSAGEIVDFMDLQGGELTISFDFLYGNEWTAEVGGTGTVIPAAGNSSGSFSFGYYPGFGYETITLHGSGDVGSCEVVVEFYIYDEYSQPMIYATSVNPNPVDLGSQTVLTFSITDPCLNWQITSMMGNQITPDHGSGPGTFQATVQVTYADEQPYNDDILKIVARGINFGIHSEENVVVTITIP